MSKLKPALFVIPICVICFLICVISSYASEESLTITTYYPSPYGSYRELRAQRIAIGDNYIAGDQYCWEGTCTNTINANADLVVEGNVGIGTTGPVTKLQVAGGDIQLDNGQGVWFRSAGGIAASNNGMTGNDATDILTFRTAAIDRLTIKSGNVGIGTASPNAKLDVRPTDTSRPTNLCVRVDYTSSSGTTNCPTGYYIALGSYATMVTPPAPGYIICCQACIDANANGVCD